VKLILNVDFYVLHTCNSSADGCNISQICCPKMDRLDQIRSNN